MKRQILVGCALALCASNPLAAQRSPTPDTRVASLVRPDAIWAPLKLLSSDLLEGRGTARRGGELAAQYIASQFMALGLEPAGDSGSFFQHVPIVALNPSPVLAVAAGAPARELKYREDYVAWSERADTLAQAAGELVFVGYGITAPEWQWDDFKGMDLRGKILLMLVNDPGIGNLAIFRGKILTYYGRWTYKLEEAARQGAAGVLLVHNDSMATYGWNTVRNSWTGEQVRLDTPPTSLAFGGWITQAAAGELLRPRGLDLGALIASAGRRDFRPVPTGIELAVTVHSQLTRMTTDNVIGRLPGRDPRLKNEVVFVSAHWDHFGIVPPVNGDSIMNGTVDNASGVAAMLGIADAFAHDPVRPKRSIMFVGMALEESGLLGSAWLAAHPPVPPARVAADLNLDVVNLFGPTRDISAVGADQSTLGRLFDAAARAEHLRVEVDSVALSHGSFFRADHFSFAKAGVPATTPGSAYDFVGKPAGWGRQQKDLYDRERYHQPADNLLPWYSPDGAVQQARVLARVAWVVAEATGQPTWYPTSEFAAAGRQRVGR